MRPVYAVTSVHRVHTFVNYGPTQWCYALRTGSDRSQLDAIYDEDAIIDVKYGQVGFTSVNLFVACGNDF